jgi:hypothetical protein
LEFGAVSTICNVRTIPAAGRMPMASTALAGGAPIARFRDFDARLPARGASDNDVEVRRRNSSAVFSLTLRHKSCIPSEQV